MRPLRALAASGLLALVLLPLIFLPAAPAVAAPDPNSQACYRHRILESAQNEDGVYIDPAVMELAQYHCEQDVEAAESVPLAPFDQPYRPRQGACDDTASRLGQADCIADWTDFARYNYSRPRPCIAVANAERQGQAPTDDQRRACEQEEAERAAERVPPSGDQAQSSDDGWKAWWHRQTPVRKALLIAMAVCLALIFVLGAVGVVLKLLGAKGNSNQTQNYRPPPPPFPGG